MNELALFAGAGGGILGGHLLGWKTVCAVEIEPYPREVLLQRQRDRILPIFPIWDDVTTFDGKPWRGRVDIVTGGFPCQDISAAGRGEGITGERSGLWREMARIICEVRPPFVLVENSPMLTSRGLGVVLGDLAEMGFYARWGVLGGFSAGLCANGERVWIFAYAPDSNRRFKGKVFSQKLYSIGSSRRQFDRAIGSLISQEANAEYMRNPDGLARRMGEFRVIGNGQVPRVVRLAVRTLMG